MFFSLFDEISTASFFKLFLSYISFAGFWKRVWTHFVFFNIKQVCAGFAESFLESKLFKHMIFLVRDWDDSEELGIVPNGFRKLVSSPASKGQICDERGKGSSPIQIKAMNLNLTFLCLNSFFIMGGALL